MTQRALDDFNNASTGLFKDNTAGDISALDLRDFAESLKLSAGSIYVTTPAETTISVVSTWTVAAGTFALNPDASQHRVDNPSGGRLRYTGTPTVHAHIAASLSITAAASNKLVGMALGKNGTVITHSIQQRQIGTGSDVGSTALHADVDLATNDYLEILLANETDTANLTLELGYLFMMGMFV